MYSSICVLERALSGCKVLGPLLAKRHREGPPAGQVSESRKDALLYIPEALDAPNTEDVDVVRMNHDC